MPYLPPLLELRSIMHVMVWTHLDMSQVVSVVSRYMFDPHKEQWQAMKWILHYLKDTTNIGLMYDSSSSFTINVVEYTDFNYAEKLD